MMISFRKQDPFYDYSQVFSEETLAKKQKNTWQSQAPRNGPFIQENFLEILSDLRSGYFINPLVQKSPV